MESASMGPHGPPSMDPKMFIEHAEHYFGRRAPMIQLWQEIALHFYPERADFTGNTLTGKDYASNLTTSYPLLVRRELGNAIAAMLRPRTQEWFKISIDEPERLDRAGQAWLERATAIQRRDMYARSSQFVRATKEGDHDFATFGQAPIQISRDWRTGSLVYQTWHLRDVCWTEQPNGEIGAVYRRWKVPLMTGRQYFGPKLCAQARHETNQFADYEFLHCVMPAADCDCMGMAINRPWLSVWIDVRNKHVIEAVPMPTRGYIIPRFQTMSGSQYAFSPATWAGLPDARLLQAMALTLLEAGEMAVRPPMVATKDVIKGTIELFSGGVTWLDREYDERLGDALRPITQDRTGLPFGLEMTRDSREMLAQAFYLNKISLPQVDKEMTAYEANQRMQEYVRGALPLFEPAESEYNGALCEETFELEMRAGRFGPYEDIPQSVRGAETRFVFESPIHDALERQKGLRFSEAREMILGAAELDRSAGLIIDVRRALREARSAVGVPAAWQRDEDEVEQMTQDMDDEQADNAALQQVAAGGEAAERMGKGMKALVDADAA